MTDWLSKLELLDIPDGAVAGLSNADKPFMHVLLLNDNECTGQKQLGAIVPALLLVTDVIV